MSGPDSARGESRAKSSADRLRAKSSADRPRGVRGVHRLLSVGLLVGAVAAIATIAWHRFDRGLAEDRVLLRALGVARSAARLVESGRGTVTPSLITFGNQVGTSAPDVLRLVVLDTGSADANGIRRGANAIYAMDGKTGATAEVDRPLANRLNNLVMRFTSPGSDKPIPLAELVEVAENEPGMLRVGAIAPVVVDGKLAGAAGALVRVPAALPSWPWLPAALAVATLGLFALLSAFSAPRVAVGLTFLVLAGACPIVYGLASQSAIRNHLAERADDWLTTQAMADAEGAFALAAPIAGREIWSPDGALRLERVPLAAPVAADALRSGEGRVGNTVASVAVHPDIVSDLAVTYDPEVLGWSLLAALLLALTALPFATLLENLIRDPGVYAYVSPAVVGLIVLVVAPFMTGIGLAFYHYQVEGHFYTYIGFGNFKEIIAPSDTTGIHFWRTLVVTVVWTVSNVLLHVTIGLGLALLLNRPGLIMKRMYRVLLVLPWAVPSYITALLWRSMFVGDYGPMNRMLGAMGIGPIKWFDDHFWTNFVPNLVTNTWLGFPFMMVVALGALQSIPADLYEAAELDGASAWQRFRHVTLPLLKPALLPAVILGTIWTFNLFNVIYLVSKGGGGTEILITEAYRTFHEQHRHGYAAAYSVMIFLILLGYTWITTKVTKASEGAVS